MEPVFVKAVPEIEIEDGLVHVRYGNGARDCYWKMDTMEDFASEVLGAIHEWRETHRPVPMRR